MKTIWKVVGGVSVIAMLLTVASVEVQARGSWGVSIGYGGAYGGYYRGGYRGWGWGIGVSPTYCYPSPYYYYYPAPAYYYSSPPPVVYTQPIATPAPQPPPPSPSKMSPTDVKSLTKAGLADEVIISQIKQSKVVFRLTTAEIIDLKDSGVSQRVIDCMINTANK